MSCAASTIPIRIFNSKFENPVQYTTPIVNNPVWWVFVWGLHFLMSYSNLFFFFRYGTRNKLNQIAYFDYFDGYTHSIS